MSSDFRVGDEVVCINADAKHPQLDYITAAPLYLVEGHVYVVTSTFLSDKSGVPGITIRGNDYRWHADRFRKVEKKFTGMSVLTALLVSQPVAPELVH